MVNSELKFIKINKSEVYSNLLEIGTIACYVSVLTVSGVKDSNIPEYQSIDPDIIYFCLVLRCGIQEPKLKTLIPTLI